MQVSQYSFSSLASEYAYDPYGDTLTQSGPLASENPFKFSTKYEDQENGLYYYGYRYYGPELGRWLSKDPIGERGGKNLYEFAQGDPINNYDSLGLFLGIGKLIDRIDHCIDVLSLAVPGIVPPQEECAKASGAYRHCWYSCEGARCLSFLRSMGQLLIALGGLYAEYEDLGSSDVPSDITADLAGIIAAGFPSSCETSCEAVSAGLVALQCCSSNTGLDADDPDCCE